MLRFFKNICVAVLLVAFFGCSQKNDVTVINLAHGLDTKHSVHKAMVFMGERLAEKSNGKLEVHIYPNQQLGSERELVELLQIGTVGMTKVSTATMENFVPEFRVLGMPYLFRDGEHMFRVLEGEVGEELLQESTDKRLLGLAFYDSGDRNFYAKKPIKTPDDLNGMKIRVMPSKTAINMVEALGGSATPISWGELYTSLQQGIVDGAENNLPSFYLNRHYEVCKYFTMDGHTAVPDELIISTQVWEKLSEQEKKWVKEAAMESAQYQKKLWKESEDEALEGIKEAGVEIIEPDKELFRAKVEEMYKEYEKDPQLKETVKRIKAVQ